MYLIAVDPDTKNTAISVFNYETQYIKGVFVLSRFGKDFWADLEKMYKRLAKINDRITTICVEKTVVYKDKRYHINNVLAVLEVSFSIHGWLQAKYPDAKHMHPKPMDWKKNVPKDTCYQRACEYVRNPEFITETIKKNKKDDVKLDIMDSVSLAVWAGNSVHGPMQKSEFRQDLYYQ